MPRNRSYYSLEPPIVRLKYNEPSPMKVLPQSQKTLRMPVEEIAYHFKREMGFDFVQFEASEAPNSQGFVPWQAYLFHERVYEIDSDTDNTRIRCFGACCFRWREWSDAPAGWSLDWVWFHPYFRQKQHLSKAWQQFKQEYGEFHLAQPISPSMKAFLKKVQPKSVAE
jgi:hypothetical protein